MSNIKYGTVDVPDEEFLDENITVHVPFVKYKAMKHEIEVARDFADALSDMINKLEAENAALRIDLADCMRYIGEINK